MKIKKLKVEIPFKANFFFMLMILIFLAQAYMHDKNIVYLFVFFVLGIIGSNYFWLRKNLLGLDVEYINLQNPFAKEASFIHLRVKNQTKTDRIDIHIDDVNFNILAFEEREVEITHIFKSRGRHKIPISKLSSGFPLYIFDNYYSWLDFRKKVIIYPQKRGQSLKIFLAQSKNIYGERDDFKGVREYIEGDLISLIDWNSLAKGKLLTKEFEFLSDKQDLIFDYQNIKGDIETKLSQLTKWVLEAKARELEFKVKVGKKRFYSQKDSTKNILTFLAMYGENNG